MKYVKRRLIIKLHLIETNKMKITFLGHIYSFNEHCKIQFLSREIKDVNLCLPFL